jgi:hypothetical protein
MEIYDREKHITFSDMKEILTKYNYVKASKGVNRYCVYYDNYGSYFLEELTYTSKMNNFFGIELTNWYATGKKFIFKPVLNKEEFENQGMKQTMKMVLDKAIVKSLGIHGI